MAIVSSLWWMEENLAMLLIVWGIPTMECIILLAVLSYSFITELLVSIVSFAHLAVKQLTFFFKVI
jgi:hypothetical protein